MREVDMALELPKRSKAWLFTFNNYDDTIIEIFKASMIGYLGNLVVAEKSTNLLSYLIIAKELAPSTGTPHLQGYLELPKKIIGRSLMKKLPKGTALICASGTWQDNLKYCSKTDGSPFVIGDPKCQGRRSDLDGIRLMIEDGADEKEIAQAGFGNWCRYNNSFERYRRLIKEERRNWMPEIWIHWGNTRLGKSKKVYDDNELKDIWPWNGNSKFYSGYDLHSVVLFDDFYGSISLEWMLKLCDRYPLIVNLKNAHCNWQPKKIYFTCNTNPKNWKGWREEDIELRDAFWARVRESGGGVLHFNGNLGEHCLTEY